MILDEARAVLAAMFAPLAVDRFFDDLMGRGVFHLPGGAAHPRRLLAGSDPRQTVLEAFATHAGTFGYHAEAPAQPAPPILPVDSAAAFAALIRRFHERGFTVRVPDVAPLSAPLHRVTRALEFMLQQPVRTSLFWSAAAARAPIHYDDNDNLVVQLAGRKQWRIATAPPSLHNPWRDIGEVAPRLGDHHAIDLAEGDLLYIPRGTPHTVTAQTESLHLAIVFTPVTLRDAMIAALDHLADRDRSLREHVIARVDAAPDATALSRRLAEALRRLHEAVRSPDFVASALQHRASRTIGNLERLAGATPPALTPASRVRHNPLAMCHMLATPTTVDFCQPGEHINIHRGAEPALRFISRTVTFRVADLPGDLTDDVKVALVARLITSGFLEPAG